MEAGKNRLKEPAQRMEFAKNDVADDLINNISQYPHAFVLACVMDRQINAERAWIIPYKVASEIGGPEFPKFLNASLSDIKSIFLKNKLHRFNDVMSENFYLAVQRIQEDYKGLASNIWDGAPRSATIVIRFLKFKGVGKKIATMAANILARRFKVDMQDHYCIDISPDVHVKRVFARLGFISKDSSEDELIYSARELNPSYPGIFDAPCWDIGKNWCRPSNPMCEKCYLSSYCPKKI